MKLPEFDELQRALQSSSALVGASEGHGLLCGLLCGRAEVSLADWSEHLFEEPAPAGDVTRRDCDRILKRALTASVDGLLDDQFGFRLLLPGDSADLAERTRCLAEWAQGFVFGLGVGGLGRDWRLSSDSTELLADFEQLARAEFDAESSDDQDEADFAEVLEFLRVGVLVIHRELRPLRDPLAAHDSDYADEGETDPDRRTLH